MNEWKRGKNRPADTIDLLRRYCVKCWELHTFGTVQMVNRISWEVKKILRRSEKNFKNWPISGYAPKNCYVKVNDIRKSNNFWMILLISEYKKFMKVKSKLKNIIKN